MKRWFTLFAAVLIAGTAAVATADAQVSNSDEPPLIAGRVALVEGDAQIWRTEEDNAGQWDAAMVNDVVSVGTGLYTGNDGRNEVRIGPNTVRLGPDSRGGFSQLDYATAVFNLEYGTANLSLARPEHGETTAVTVSGVRVDLVAPGRYRIDATDRGPMRLTVFEGHGTVRSSNDAVGVAASQALVVQPGGGVNFEQPTTTGFDQWALNRDQQYSQVRSAQYVSPYMTGYEQLDTYGDWVPDATYGTVWYPRAVPSGWAPYRDGQWRWVRPWGWTWVDYAPWGYAPFHYGRWVMVGPRWCWVPGGYVRRPVWAPALVGFVGSGVSVAVGVGPVVGWYPLAPWHRYEPHYRHNPRYVTVINQTVINRPPRGVSPTINQGPGATMVPGPRFRDPVMKAALPAQARPDQLKPVAPPPLTIAPAPRPVNRKFAEQQGPQAPPPAPGTPSAPAARGAQPTPGQPAPRGAPPPATRVTPSIVAEPAPGRGVAAQPPMPGNDPAPLTQPPGLKRGQQPVQPPPAPTAPAPTRPTPRPHLPSDQIPPGQPQPINPAEPARFPPGAPPTVRQPPPMAPAARPVQPAPLPGQASAAQPQARPVQPAPPPVQPQAAPRARPAAPVAAPAAPAVAAPVAPAPKAHPPQAHGAERAQPEPGQGKPEREGPPPRPKQSDR